MRVFTFSTLFPNREAPHHGIFVAERLKHLLAETEIRASVMAPVPWFPLSSPAFGQYSQHARVPDRGTFADAIVHHPRYPLIPKVGMSSAPLLLAAASRRAIKRHYGDLSDFDLIDAHYFYPDGVAAVMLGQWFGKPVVITGRGTDLNLIPDYRLPRAMIRRAADRAAGLITVSEALRKRLIDLGASADKVRTLRNGVDLERFRPIDREEARKKLGMRRRTLLSVGLLIERKGHHFVIESLKLLRNTDLVIAGSGPQESELRRLADRLEVSDRVQFLGAMDQASLLEYYNAADCLVLCSSREGMANVLLESLACGTPVVATPIWGTPEVVNSPAAGVLMKERSAASVADAVRKLWSAYPDRAETRAYSERFSWRSTTAGQMEVFERALRYGAAG